MEFVYYAWAGLPLSQPKPATRTKKKKGNQPSNPHAVREFCEQFIYPVAGEKITFKEFRSRFFAWIGLDQQRGWTFERLSRAVPTRHRTGLANHNVTVLINASWEDQPPTGPKLRVVNGRVRPAGDA